MGWLPTAVGKSIMPSTDFRLVYLECMVLPCQTSALAIKHAMVTIALRASAPPGLVIITSVKTEKEWGKKAVQKSSGKMIGLEHQAAARQLRLLLPCWGAGELIQLWPPFAPSVDLSACITHSSTASPDIGKYAQPCQCNICASAPLCMMNKPAKSSPDLGAFG